MDDVAVARAVTDLDAEIPRCYRGRTFELQERKDIARDDTRDRGRCSPQRFDEVLIYFDLLFSRRTLKTRALVLPSIDVPAG